jgi:hypothetical protein
MTLREMMAQNAPKTVTPESEYRSRVAQLALIQARSAALRGAR